MTCPKNTRAKPCSGSMHEVTCPEVDTSISPRDWCRRTFYRCRVHGGKSGALRSLKSHKALYHPKEK